MQKPALQDDAFLADVAAARAEAHALKLWWLGQSGFLVQWQGKHLLLDPYLSDSLTKKYAATDKPHVRMTERVIDPVRLDFVDVVTSSHNHTDHLDAETLLPLFAAAPQARPVIAEANRQFVAERLGCDPAWPLGLAAGESVAMAGFRITAIPAAHEQRELDEQGRDKFVGFIVECGEGLAGWTIYHSGDTLLYAGMHEWLQRWRIDVALLPINGHDPARGVAGNLDGREAATLAHDLGIGLVIPCHYDMFTFNTASPGQFIAVCNQRGQQYAILRNGQRWTGIKS